MRTRVARTGPARDPVLTAVAVGRQRRAAVPVDDADVRQACRWPARWRCRPAGTGPSIAAFHGRLRGWGPAPLNEAGRQKGFAGHWRAFVQTPSPDLPIIGLPASLTRIDRSTPCTRSSLNCASCTLAGAIDDAITARAIARERGEVLSLFQELRLTLYVGVALVAAGAGLLLKDRLAQLGPLTLCALVALAAAPAMPWLFAAPCSGAAAHWRVTTFCCWGAAAQRRPGFHGVSIPLARTGTGRCTCCC